MITLNIPYDTKRTVWNFLKHNNVGNRGKADGNKEEQYVGLLGETMVKNYLGVDDVLRNGFDGGYDIEFKGMKIDVKTMGRKVNPKLHYVNNFISYQSDFNCCAYIFCSINKLTSELTICGWLTKKQLFSRACLYKEGAIRTRSDGTTFKMKAPTYEIKNSMLNGIETI